MAKEGAGRAYEAEPDSSEKKKGTRGTEVEKSRAEHIGQGMAGRYAERDT